MSSSNVNNKNVGKNITYLRKLRGYTQEKLAKKMHITQSAYSKFEVHGDKIRTTTLWKIGEALDVFPMFLMHTAVHDEKAPTHDILIDVIKNYPAEEQYDKYFEALRKENEDQGIIEQRSGFKVDNLASMCMSIFDSLNDKGRREAIKRLNELAQLDQYKKED